MANMQGQDWNPVILSKRRPGAKESQTPAVREKRREKEREHNPALRARAARPCARDRSRPSPHACGAPPVLALCRYVLASRGEESGRGGWAAAPEGRPLPSPSQPCLSPSLSFHHKALQAALRAGQVDAVKKFGGANKAHGAAGAVKDAAKLDRETEELSHER